MFIAIFFALTLFAVIFIPQYAIVILALNLVVGLFLSLLQITAVLLPRPKICTKQLKNHPFVSILVPSYNEPPAILIETLKKLSQLNYDRFEVLVMDNNTKDPAVWRPVENFVTTLGPKFRFFHKDHLSGFKAGALNYLLKHLNKESEYVAVVDADYVVRKGFLNIALPYFASEDVALVQFPQQYRNRTRANEPIIDEYNHFFEVYMNMANQLDCVPATGTVSIYRLSALLRVNGFRNEALTEDADIGLRIYAAGYRGVYVNRSVGFGLMPHDLEAYIKQKRRWALGNAQSLKILFSLFGKIPFRSWLGFLSHLTAWHHFNFLPFATLAAFPILLLPFIPITPVQKETITFVSLIILVTMAVKLILFMAALRHEERPVSRALRAFVFHMGMTLVYSEAWFTVVFRTKPVFERTNKFILKKISGFVKNSYKELLLGLWFLLGAIEAILWGRTITVVTSFIAAANLFSIFYVYRIIIPTKPCSKKILSKLENRYQYFVSVITPQKPSKTVQPFKYKHYNFDALTHSINPNNP